MEEGAVGLERVGGGGGGTEGLPTRLRKGNCLS